MRAEEVVEQSRRYAAAYDRSRLGRFAIEEEAFALGHAIQTLITVSPEVRVLMTYPDDVEGSWEYRVRLLRYELDAVLAVTGTPILHVDAELSFWSRVLCGSSSTTDIRRRLLELQDIYSADVSFHDYFAVGIWDKAAIERFVAAGIDPELALVVI